MTKLGFYTLFTVSLLAVASSRSCRHSEGSYSTTRPPWNIHESSYSRTTSTPPVPSTTSTTSAASPRNTATGGYIQSPAGNASFTVYTGCSAAACGYTATRGYTAAMNQLSFGAAGGEGAGDACGRCFAITGSADPYTPSYTTAWKTIVVKITDLCPAAPNENWCGQTRDHPLNQENMSVHFDLCQDSGASQAFFPEGRGALTGFYQEVSCSKWSGIDGNPLWNGACIAGEKAANWPAVACENKGTAP